MKAVLFAEYGGPEVLHLVDVDEPHAGSGQVRIAVRAASVNGIDWRIRAGYMREMLALPLPAGTVWIRPGWSTRSVTMSTASRP